METNAAGAPRDFSQPPTQPIARKSFSRMPAGHAVPQRGGDGFIPMLVAAALIASAVLLALD